MKLTSFPGRSRGFASRVEEQRGALFRVAYAWTRDRALADDLAQEALAKALERAQQLRDPERLRDKGVQARLLPQATVATSALDQIVKRIHEGWTYVRA